MTNVILFGATGSIGRQIAAALFKQPYQVTAVVRSEEKAKQLAAYTNRCLVANLNPDSLKGICKGYEIVISALGKSVSPSDKSRASFHDIDTVLNTHILNEAINSQVKKFVYVSALHSEKFPHLAYFKAHHVIEEKLKISGLDYSIIKPPAVFSAFNDLMVMARKGQLVTLGKGEKLTNPIYEGDLAQVCVDAISLQNAVIEVGGKEILSRKQINEIIQHHVNPQKKVRSIPLSIVKRGLPILKLFSRNTYDKMAFFTEVMQHDTIAPPVGETRLSTYIKNKIEQAQ